jgi:hypothetical protein
MEKKIVNMKRSVHQVTTEDKEEHKRYKTTNTVSLVSIGKDCIDNIVNYLPTVQEWIQFSYTCKDVNKLKYDTSVMRNKRKTLRIDATLNEVSELAKQANGTMINVKIWNRKDVDLILDCIQQYNQMYSLKLKLCGTEDSVLTHHLRGIHELYVCTESTICITDDSIKYMQGTIHILEIPGRSRITNEVFKYLQGTIHTLNICGCGTITNEAFKYLQGTIHTLDISWCNITDEAFKYLQGTIHTLNIAYCKQLTHEAFKYLQGTIHTLSIHDCGTITNEAFKYLQGTIHTLNIAYCKQLTHEAFKYLEGTIHTLSIHDCDTITNEAFKYLQGTIHTLRIRGNKNISDEAFEYLQRSQLKILTIEHSDISSNALQNLHGTLHTLHLDSNDNIGERGFKNLHGITHRLFIHSSDRLFSSKFFNLLHRTIHTLELWDIGDLLRDEAFKCLQGISLHKLVLRRCNQVTNTAFQYLPKSLQVLTIDQCRKITSEAFNYMKGKSFHTLELYLVEFVTDETFLTNNISVTHRFLIDSISVTDRVFSCLKGTIHTLILYNNRNITDEAFKLLPKLRYLHFLECPKLTTRLLSYSKYVHLSRYQPLKQFNETSEVN